MKANEARQLTAQAKKNKEAEEALAAAELKCKNKIFETKQAKQAKLFFEKVFPNEVARIAAEQGNRMAFVSKFKEYEVDGEKLEFWTNEDFMRALAKLCRAAGYEVDFHSSMTRYCDECNEQESWYLEIKW